MRIWFSGPRILGIRPGISLGREDLAKAKSTQRAPGKAMGCGFVYAIRGDHNLVKIGVSQNPMARLASLRTASAFPLEFCFIGACNTSGIEIEREAHRLLAPHHTNGEWFDCSPELAASAIFGAAATLGQKIASVPPNMVAQVVALSTGADPRPKDSVPGSFAKALVIGTLRVAAVIVSVTLIIAGSFILYAILTAN